MFKFFIAIIMSIITAFSSTGIIGSLFPWNRQKKPDTDDPVIVVPQDILLVSNEEFINGCYYNDGTLKNSSKPFSQVKTHESFISPQIIKIVITDTANDVSDGKYVTVISAWDSQKHIMNPNDSVNSKYDLKDGAITFNLPVLYPDASWFKIDIMSYDGNFYDIPSTASINIYSSKEEQKPQTSEFADKKIDILGDSITAEGGYIAELKKLTDAPIIFNHGISGQKMTQFASRVGELSHDSDIIIIFGGTNDYWHHETSIGTLSDSESTTFCGALNVIYNKLKTDYPNARYLFVFPPHQTFGGKNDTYNWGFGTLNDFRIAMRDFCSAKNVSFFDLNTVEDWDPSVHTRDGVHPNASGSEIIAGALYDYMKANFR